MKMKGEREEDIRTFVVFLDYDECFVGIEICLPNVFFQKIIRDALVVALLDTVFERRKHIVKKFVVLVIQCVFVKTARGIAILIVVVVVTGIHYFVVSE